MTKEDILVFLKDNYRYSAENIFKNKFNAEYEEILKTNFPNEFTFAQKLYHWLNNDTLFSLGTCSCGNRCRFKSLHLGYNAHCSVKCAANSDTVKSKTKNTNLSKYGNACSLHGNDVEEKTKKTMLEKYGVEHPLASKQIQQKYKDTCVKNYGVEHPLQSKQIMQKLETTNTNKYGAKQVFSLDGIKEKIKNTNLERYGVEYTWQSQEIKEKIKKTNFGKLGVEWPMQSEHVKEKSRQTCYEKYGVEHTSQANVTKQHMKETNLKKYGVEWYCLTKDCRIHSNDSGPNLEFAKLLDENNIMYEREFTLENYSYDFKIDDILIEVNPTITHNSCINIFGGEPKDKNYHLNKLNCAKEHNYSCIHVWDWDDKSKIVNMLKSKETLYARNLELREVSEMECNEFLNLYHLQNTCKGQKIRYGLYKDETLVQIMTFGKPRYNKKYELELLRLCSHKDYKIVGGAEKIFKYILDKFKPENIISYCDNSKFSGKVYKKLGFSLKTKPNPSKHWYNPKSKQHITDNLLRQRGFDQIFNTNYGKGTSNEELMLEYSFLSIYDCGQMTFVFK